jgi:hypothetical protein
MKRLTFSGQLTSGMQWMTGKESKWEAVCNAHRGELPDIHQYVPGTFNVELREPASWRPPLDEYFRLQARRRGLEVGKGNCQQGADFLFCGNYIHPLLRVVLINQHPVDGRIYYPGTSSWTFDDDGMPNPLTDKRTRLEVISKSRLRPLLQMDDTNRRHEIQIVLEVLPPPWLS